MNVHPSSVWRRYVRLGVVGVSLTLPPFPNAVAPTPPPLAREFRGVWVATVGNIDWPSSRSLSTAEQQRELLAILDRAAALRLNAVVLQVRPGADALYQSALEPWSEYLTGVQGRAPAPFWDPLAFAIREAHARHLELHAWFNPYRAQYDGSHSPLAPNHIARTHPALVTRYAHFLWMDPGEPAVRLRTIQVVLDVVKRYDIDGVHLDDYFYPYPERDRRGRVIAFNDTRSWTRYTKQRGALSRADWRRQNVDALVHELGTQIHRAKPWVKFGISPYGIWRAGFPTQVRGFGSYDGLFADARKWLNEGWVDYFTPQLYWPTTKVEQAYPALLAWWAGENTFNRHLWPGNFTSRAGTSGGGSFPVSELLAQIQTTRAQAGATGNVHFSMKTFLLNQGGINDALASGPYGESALVPASPWLDVPPPPVPAPQLAEMNGARQLQLAVAGAPSSRPWQWIVRVRADSTWATVVLSGSTERWLMPETDGDVVVTVSAINRAGVLSVAVPVTSAPSRSLSTPPTGPPAPPNER